MQNKHYFFFPFWESQRSGRGGQAGWAKIPTFTENLFCKLPLILLLLVIKWWNECNVREDFCCFFLLQDIVSIFEESTKIFKQIIFESGQVFFHRVVPVFLFFHLDKFFEADKIFLLSPPHFSLFTRLPFLLCLVNQPRKVVDPVEWWRKGG